MSGSTSPFPAEPGGSVNQALRYAEPVRHNAAAFASLIVGILGPIFGLLLGPLALLVGTAAVILGNRALYNIHKEPGLGGKGLAVGGVILGIIAIFIGVVGIGMMMRVLLNAPR